MGKRPTKRAGVGLATNGPAGTSKEEMGRTAQVNRVVRACGLLVLAGALVCGGCRDPRDRGVSSKMSRVRVDMRLITEALQKYFVDHNSYPPYSTEAGHSLRPRRPSEKPLPSFMIRDSAYSGATLTTPVEYLTSSALTWFQIDVFLWPERVPFGYYSTRNGWILFSVGPDCDSDLDWTAYDDKEPQPSSRLLRFAYDPTNGWVSDGDIFTVRQ